MSVNSRNYSSKIAFATAWLFVMFVSVIDGYWVWHTRDVIDEYEQNPVGQALLAANAGHVGLFLTVKALGTLFTCSCLLIIYRKNPQLGLVIAVVLAMFQFGLLLFLNYSNN
jgi:hypothetical protein